MWLRRVLWSLLGIAVVAGVLGVRAHTQRDPQCDPGFACANVDALKWSATQRNVGGLCVSMAINAEATTMFRQEEWAGFRRAASQSSSLQPTGMVMTIKANCNDELPAAGAFTEAWINYSVATDRDAIVRAHAEAARSMSDPTRATIVRGKDANWLYTVARVPADTGILRDSFGADLMMSVPKHWSRELGELRLPCLWVSVEGSMVVGETSYPIALAPSAAPVHVCGEGRGDAWYDKLDGFFDN